MLYLINSFVMALQGLSIVAFYDALLVPRFRRRMAYLVCAVTSFSAALIKAKFVRFFALTTSMVLLTYAAILFFLYLGKNRQKILILLSQLLFDSTLEIVVSLLLWGLFPQLLDFYTPLEMSWVRILGSVLFLFCHLLFVATVWHFKKKAGGKLTLPFSGLALFLCTSQALLFFAFFSALTFSNVRTSLIAGSFAAVVTIAADFLALRVIRDARQKRETQERLVLIEKVHEAKLEFYRDSQEKAQQFAKQRHDFAGHLYALGALVQQQKTNDATDYIAQLTQRMEETNLHHYTAHVVTDAVVSNVAEQCKEHGIPFETNITMPPNLSIRAVHVCSVLSNLLSNAQKASLLLPAQQRSIILSILYKQGCLVIKCKNKYSGSAAFTDSTGYGTQILQDIATLYNGTYTVSAQDGWYLASLALIEQPNARP